MAASTKANSDRLIEIVRVIKAPPELVFDSFTDREHISHWWGPHGFTTTTKRMDVRPGGEWRFVMHGPDGTDYQNLIAYSVVERPKRLVYDHSEPGGGMKPFHVTVTFDKVSGGTRVTLALLLASAEVKSEMARFGAIEGGENTLHRLEMRLARAAAQSDLKPFTVTRTFDAPRDLVWKAWTEPERLSQWWGPKGCKIELGDFDFRAGGLFHYAMIFSTGARMYGRFIYREIAQPDRLVYLSSFANEKGGIAVAPFDPNFPLECENRVSMEQREGKTVLSIVSLPFGATAEGITAFEKLFSSMQQGYAGTMDQLADHLAKGR